MYACGPRRSPISFNRRLRTSSAAVSNYFLSISSLRSAQSENDELKQRIQELEVEIKQKDDLAAENERLRSLLQLKEQSKYKVLTARIIGRDPSFWFDSSIINRGSLDGVTLNMAVVTDGGLVGRVTAVSPLTSQVDLITYNKSGVGGIVGEIGTSNALGVVNGTSKKDLLEMKYVPGTVDVQVGQPVFTTGQDGIFPPGAEDRGNCQRCPRFGYNAAADPHSAGCQAQLDAGGRRPAVRTAGTARIRPEIAECR